MVWTYTYWMEQGLLLGRSENTHDDDDDNFEKKIFTSFIDGVIIIYLGIQMENWLFLVIAIICLHIKKEYDKRFLLTKRGNSCCFKRSHQICCRATK